MDEVTAEHSGNPEAWGQKAKLLYGHGKVEEAEEALEKAFALNRNYPYGLLLRAAFRFQEGEVAGALLLARRAADAYDPEARDYLAEAYSLVYECEMKLNRPVAAPRRAANRPPLAAGRRRDARGFRPGVRRKITSAGRRPARVHVNASGPRLAPGDEPRRSPGWRGIGAAGRPVAAPGELARAFDELTARTPATPPPGTTSACLAPGSATTPAALDALNHYLELEPTKARRRRPRR